MTPDYGWRLLTPKGNGVPVALAVADGAIVAGEASSLETYAERYGNPARHELRLRDLTLADMPEERKSHGSRQVIR